MFFQQKAENEDMLYSRIRDYPEYCCVRDQIENLWSVYQDLAPRRFLGEAQNNNCFHQRWWEMYCGVGLKRLFSNVKTNTRDEGPDFELACNGNKCFIEAIAPKTGNNIQKLQPMQLNGCFPLPEKEFLLRIAAAIKEKTNKFHEYIKKGDVSTDDLIIIALSSCDLSQFGSLMDYPIPAPLKVLQGYGHLCINTFSGEIGIAERIPIEKNNGSKVNTKMFELEEMKIISAILYSNTDPLNSPHEPEKTFILIRNPNATKGINENLFNKVY